jgi:hypothetical protein
LKKAYGKGASDTQLMTRVKVDPISGGTGMRVNFVRIIKNSTPLMVSEGFSIIPVFEGEGEEKLNYKENPNSIKKSTKVSEVKKRETKIENKQPKLETIKLKQTETAEEEEDEGC